MSNRESASCARSVPPVHLLGVLGFPVGHSRSPAMMRAAFAELGLADWRYFKLPVPPERFAETVRALPGSGYRGANVTIPHKVAAYELADERSGAAEAIGAANTLVFDEGRIVADNTDAGGLIDSLPRAPRGMTALVLGAGGAGRAAVWALREAGADVAVWNRTAERARALASEMGVREGLAPAELVVNATSVGLTEGSLPLQGLDPQVVVDLVYAAEPTPVERWGAERGAEVVGGLEILVRQGARSLELWTGRQAPVDAMRAAAV
jgi:shikimate dehydrogenase